MRRITLLAICVLLVTAFVLISPSSRVAAAGEPTNIQFHIGCSSFTASADATDGFGFFVYSASPVFSSGDILPGTGHITISGDYGVTLPQGTIVQYLYGDFNVPTGGGSTPCSDDSGIAGPPIPSGFVLRTITCTTAVYDAVGGNPVATGEVVTAGQTWFTNPTAVKDAKGKWWTEIFVSGVSNGFIPTSCVGGKPANYGGN